MPNNHRKNHSAAGANSQSRQILPSSWWCDACKQDLDLDRFSDTQLEKVAEYYKSLLVGKGGGHEGKAKGSAAQKTVHATCRECTPKQVNVIICKVCNKEQPLEGFSKAQRRMAAKDNGARCLKCVKLRDDLDWVEDEGPGTIRANLAEIDNGQDADDDGAAFAGQGTESNSKSRREPQFFLPPF